MRQILVRLRIQPALDRVRGERHDECLESPVTFTLVDRDDLRCNHLRSFEPRQVPNSPGNSNVCAHRKTPMPAEVAPATARTRVGAGALQRVHDTMEAREISTPGPLKATLCLGFNPLKVRSGYVAFKVHSRMLACPT